jgi:pyruvate dehydrogenase (quinone)
MRAMEGAPKFVESQQLPDPSVPPIPPHTTFEQAKDAAMAMLKGDPDRWAVLKEGFMTKAREILPGKSD